jgi:hypothetical protein
LTIAPSDTGSTISAAPSAASPVKLGVASSGSGPVTVTLGAAANDLANWGGLVVKGSSAGGGTIATLGANQTFAQANVIGGVLSIPGGRTLTAPVTLGSGGALGGTGTVAGTVAVNSGGVLLPGDQGAIGQLTVGASTWAGGGRYIFEFNSLTPNPGTANDHVNSSGALNITANSSTPFLFDINGVNPPAVGTSPVSYTIGTFAGGISGFAASAFSFVPTGWFSDVPTIAQQGNNLILTFTPVPEPLGILALGTGALGLAGWLRRRKR